MSRKWEIRDFYPETDVVEVPEHEDAAESEEDYR